MSPGVYSLREVPQPCEGCETPTIGQRKRAASHALHVNNSLSGVVTGLTPWTVYTVTVAGYNNAGLGELYIDVITTIDSSKCIFCLQVKNKTFSYYSSKVLFRSQNVLNF